MRGYPRKSLLFILFFCVQFCAYGNLPEAAKERVAEQKGAFQVVLSKLTKEQHLLVLKRFADLLTKDTEFRSMKIDERELNKHLLQIFPAPNEIAKSKNNYDPKIEEISSLLKSSGGKAYLASKNRLQLPLVCNQVESLFPFDFNAEKFDLELQLRGIRIPQPDREPGTCLRVQFSRKNSILKIAWLSSQSYACPIPAEHGGECMLSIAEQIANLLGAKSIILDDNAKAACKDGSEFGLTLLGSFLKSKGWYESKGFHPMDNPAEASEKKKELLNYSLDSLSANIEVHENDVGPIMANLFKTRIDEYRKDQPGKTTAGFMKWLWENYCSDYAKADLFFRADRALDFSKLYKVPERLIKKLK